MIDEASKGGRASAREKAKAAKKGPKPVTTDRLVLEGESENAVLKATRADSIKNGLK